MAEQISQLVDGEVDDRMLDEVLSELDSPVGKAEWHVYHLIGDTLRDTRALAPDFTSSFAARLAAEPTVLAPRQPRRKIVQTIWAAAASLTAVGLVGWIGLQGVSTVAGRSDARPTLVSSSREPNFHEYLMVHQEYSPATAIQGVRPYIRTVSQTEADR